jgi:hypothetical protein
MVSLFSLARRVNQRRAETNDARGLKEEHHMRSRLAFLTVAAACALSTTANVYAQPPTSRMMTFNGLPTILAPNTPGAFTLGIFELAAGGPPVVQETQNLITDGSRRLSFVLGATIGGLDPMHFPSGSSRFLDVLNAAGASVLVGGRLPLTAAPFAISAPPAAGVQTVSAANGSIVVGGSPANPAIAVAPNGIGNAHVANGAIGPAKITGTAATLGANTFSSNQKVNGAVNVTGNVSAGSVTANSAGTAVHGIGATGGQFETGTGVILRGRGLGWDRFSIAANGDTWMNGNLRVDGGVSVGGAGTVAVDAPGVVGGRLMITPAGNVGIGKVPFAKFDVNGGASISGDTFIGGALDIGATFIMSSPVTIAPRTMGTAIAICPAGAKVLSGGFDIGGPGVTAARTLTATWPASKDRWRVDVANDPGPIGGANITVFATAVCARIKLF